MIEELKELMEDMNKEQDRRILETIEEVMKSKKAGLEQTLHEMMEKSDKDGIASDQEVMVQITKQTMGYIVERHLKEVMKGQLNPESIMPSVIGAIVLGYKFGTWQGKK